MIQFGDCYRGRRVLITGHTGFKGSWLALWLNELGADVSGISLDPDTQPNHWDLLGLRIDDHRLDIRDLEKVNSTMAKIRPDVVFHLAAQPLVRRSYRDPIENWSSNVMGTAHVLEAGRCVDSVQAIVAITTDKIYENKERAQGYRESDPLGGHDPYSASKAACELLIDSYRKAFFSDQNSPFLASARAGNVIGGGDWAEDRLIPDLVRAVAESELLTIRSPHATRPWQHVLECLAGYLLLGQRLLENGPDFAEAWNFGPRSEDNRTVAEILNALQTHWPDIAWQQTVSPQPHEATLLYLDSQKANEKLDWRPVWSLDQALQATADWYRAFQEQGLATTGEQLAAYVSDAHSAGVSWVHA
ncbi:MAG: CDP-glucose 4,6-dehydratase [Woeseiaceae bacterium]|nr:CDP-glucose 4,6-dehydratase [Woeseiaceae bacterium]